MKERYLITGGAGFIGTNLADHYLNYGGHVTIFDNFSRAGTESNAAWLRARHPDRLNVVRGDVRGPAKNSRSWSRTRKSFFISPRKSRLRPRLPTLSRISRSTLGERST